MLTPLRSLCLFAVFALSAVLVLAPQSYGQQSQSDNTLTIVEYGDYQCPACRSYHIFLERLKKDFGDSLKVQFEHFPLQTHPYAGLAARAAEAARNQGKFTEMHNMLFENQKQWTNSSARLIIKGYARDLNLDIEQFEEDWNSLETFNTVRDDKERGKKMNVRGTPTLFIEGEEIPLPMNYSQLKAYLQKQIAAL